jgi:hypothetical protein
LPLTLPTIQNRKMNLDASNPARASLVPRYSGDAMTVQRNGAGGFLESARWPFF